MTLQEQLDKARWSVKYHSGEAKRHADDAQMYNKMAAMLEAEISTLKALEVHDLPEMRRELRESADIPVAPLGD